MLNKFFAAAAVASLSISPALAAPAANVSAAKSVRASAPTAKQSELGGGFGIAGLAILAGIAAIGVIAIVNGDDDDDSDSN